MTTPPPLTWPANKVRQTFLDFFCKRNGHLFFPTAPVVPLRDPTLLFNNSGMAQFKSIFLGTADPNTDFGRMKRVSNSQMCIRAGGKHNDLDDVGKDTYHHTFFEMLGNWSFGDYFKKEAIEMAWTLLTEVYAIPKERLYVTYFGGNEKAKLQPDLETKELWKKFVAEDHLLSGSMKDNFWEMGDTGPCGPCTEIHYDRIGGRNARDIVNHDDPNVIEVWNLVFMEFCRSDDGSLSKLPAQHVDTGMGFERLVSILQDKRSNYDTDVWSGIFSEIQRVTKYPYSYTYEGPERSQDVIVAYRVIADHIRCVTAAICDGAVPDAVGRGFVVRRIIRRAIRFGNQFMNAEVGFFHQLVDAVVTSLGGFFPHLALDINVRRVKTIIREEEEGFAKTWQVGLKHFEKAKETSVKAHSTVISGQDAFILHDRYGFPVDLTTLMAERESMTVDTAGFAAEMKANQLSGGRVAMAKTFFDAYQVDELQKRGVPPTEDDEKYVWQPSKGRVLALFDKSKVEFLNTLHGTPAEKDKTGIVLDKSSFYAECGGQTYDTGMLTSTKAQFEVTMTYTYGGYVVHVGNLLSGQIDLNDEVSLSVDYARRLPIAANHTATHSLNCILREVLQYGHPDAFTEVNQKGSLVTEAILRFDFSWGSKLTTAELGEVEDKLNRAIGNDLRVFSKDVPLRVAMEIFSLRCMFDEKYPDPVKVVCIGVSVEELLKDPKNQRWKEYSIELCGGTHLRSLNEVKHAVIISEDALMKGVRRITIFTRDEARKAQERARALGNEVTTCEQDQSLEDPEDKAKALSILLKKVNDAQIPILSKIQLRELIESAIKAANNDKKAYVTRIKQRGTDIGNQLVASIPPQEALYVTEVVGVGAEREALYSVAEAITTARPNTGLFLVGVDKAKDKALAIVTLPDALVKAGLSAAEWVKQSFGKGGGKPAIAQTGIDIPAVPGTIQHAKEVAVAMKAKLH